MNRKILAAVLAVLMVFSMVILTSCGEDKPETSTPETSTPETSTPETSNSDESKAPEYEKVTFDPNKKYVYKDSVTTLATNWNPHTYQTTDDAYPADYLRVGFYSFVFNDALHPSKVEGMEEYAGYTFITEMAADFPVDVTEEIKALGNNKYNIPADATKGYAYKIALNKNAVWENGEAIKADEYIYSLKMLLGAEYQNYRATDYYSGSFCIAGAESFNKSGLTVKDPNSADGDAKQFEVADLVKNSDGTYATPDGAKAYIGLKDAGYGWLSGNTLEYYKSYFEEVYAALLALADKDGYVAVTDAALDKLYEFTGSDVWGNESKEDLGYYLSFDKTYPEFAFENVGIIKNDDYSITLVLNKSLTDFYLLYNLTGTWLVNQKLYDANLSKGSDGVWTNKYNTSVETTLSYGPYKMTGYNTDHSMRFERNTSWYGYTDGQHTYVDPTDGKEYDMYQTTEITTVVVAEAEARKEMFLKGQLMGYGLQSSDFEQYRSSDRTYFSPSETIFFFIFNGYVDAIKQREAAEGFDKAKYDLETMTLQSFRKAIAVTYDKEALCTAVSPARSGGYGIIGNNYIYDPETGAKYRETEQAKKALCDFYSVDVAKFDSLDEAVDSITGYDPVAAKALFKEAFDEALENNFITSADGKTSDQTIQITYASSAHSEFIEKTLNYLNEKLTEVLKDTPFAGKVEFVESAPLGNGWSTAIRNGTADTVLGGWSGSALDPYGLSDLYCNPNNQYDAKWFNANAVNLTIKVDGADLTMTMYEWSNALNGTPVEKDGKTYNFGYGMADTELRLEILSRIEYTVLMTYDYIPMLQDAGASLLSHQVYYVIEDYSAILGRGGMQYMKYNYDEAEWTKYIADQGGVLKY